MTSLITSSLKYQSPEIERYFRQHRVRWEQFYQSERVMLERIGLAPSAAVLDIGCGCGGLGLALKERFSLKDYTGIEINTAAASTAKDLNPEARIIAGDFLALGPEGLAAGGYDAVISLSCIDWNIGFDVMLPKAFAWVKPGGTLVLSLRLTDGPTVDDMAKSYQFINYSGETQGEKAAYVVLNARELLARLAHLQPERIDGYGYWGPPSSTAVTPFPRLCFTVLAVRKPTGTSPASPERHLELPADLLATL